MLLWARACVNGVPLFSNTTDSSLYRWHASCPLPTLSGLVLYRFADDLRAGEAWLIVEGPPAANVEFGGLTKTVVLSSPDYSNFRTFIKGK
jgi:hypothetical protein